MWPYSFRGLSNPAQPCSTRWQRRRAQHPAKGGPESLWETTKETTEFIKIKCAFCSKCLMDIGECISWWAEMMNLIYRNHIHKFKLQNLGPGFHVMVSSKTLQFQWMNQSRNPEWPLSPTHGGPYILGSNPSGDVGPRLHWVQPHWRANGQWKNQHVGDMG